VLAVPENNYTQTEVLASWTELSALATDNGSAMHGDMLEALRDSQLFSDAAGAQDSLDSATAGSPSAVVSDIWATLQRRKTLVGEAWPFLLTANSLSRRADRKLLSQVAAYATLLLIEAASSKWYSKLAIPKSAPVRTWFEHIVAASASRLLGGATHRFGAPFSAEWPKSFVERVSHLASLFEMESRDADVKKYSSEEQQDDSLDVLARWKLCDEEEGSPYVLLQCATGANWKTHKPGQPSMDLWQAYISWNGPQYKALAIPFTLRGKGELANASIRHQSAIIFDRIRIAHGNPDEAIDAELRANLVGWCQEQFAKLPTDKT
jgi:hypothetical protein